ncbi:MAG: manganese efflux pump [Firmicutes bacterium]|nr:manganese efflux pump [Bacillota bacterium]
MWQIIMTAIAVSIDGFWGGFAFGLRKTQIPLASLVIISAWSVICTSITMLAGHYFAKFIPLEIATWIGAGLLFAVGIMALKEGLEHKKARSVDIGAKPRLTLSTLLSILRDPILADLDKENDIKPSEGTLLGLAVAMDASIAAFALALNGVNPYTTPFLFGFTHFAMIGLGNVFARHQLFSYIGDRFALAPGLILIFLAFSRLWS